MLLLLLAQYRVEFVYEPENPEEVFKVTVAGSFNNWNKDANPMTYDKKEGVWKTVLCLAPGKYQYKFVINDTKWIPDPNAKEFVPDGYGGKNSVIVVTPDFPKCELKRVTLKFKPKKPVEKVTVAGSFNNWDKNANPMVFDKEEGVWKATLLLPAGEYQYKFVINDKEWVPDPNAERYVPDGYGGKNSVLVVSPEAPSLKIEKGDGIICTEMLEHVPGNRAYTNLFKEKEIQIRIKVASNDLEKVWLVTDEKIIPMEFYASDGRYDWYSAFIDFPGNTLIYCFKLQDGKKVFYFGDKGLAENRSNSGEFSVFKEELLLFETPDWVWNAVFYQIFPERFANGDPSNDPEGVKPWIYGRIYPWWERGEPEPFYGGDLEGIIQRLDYLYNLGVTAIYLNPIFKSLTSHKYDTMDYLTIDPHFGNRETFKRLLNEAHKRGIKIIIDGVFNHTADEFWAFQDVKEKGPKSKYWNWYYIKKWPFPKHFSAKDPPSKYYDCWWGFGDLPRLNSKSPGVRNYLLNKVTATWTSFGIDGWRLDVPNELEDWSFWDEFRKKVKSINPKAYIVGEIWTDATVWLQGTKFDGVMNYLLRNSLIELVVKRSINPSSFINEVYRWKINYPWQALHCLYNLLGSHDTERIFTVAKKNVKLLKLMTLIQFTLPGAPAIYYGDEIGMEGGKDPDNRRVFPWEERYWNMEIKHWYEKLIKIRKKFKALRYGDFKAVYVNDQKNLFAYARTMPKEQSVLVVINNSSTTRTLQIPVKGLWPDRTVVVDEISGNIIGRILKGRLVVYDLPALSGIVVVKR